MEPMLSAAQAAAVLGVDERTIARWIRAGRLVGQRVGQRTWGIPVSEIERIRSLPRPRPGLKKGQRLTRRYQGICQGCGQPFQAARPARFCSPRCSARFRARKRTARRRGRGSGAVPPAEGLR